MFKYAKLLQKLARSSDPVTVLRSRQLLARLRKITARSLIISRLEDWYRTFVKLPGTIDAMGLPDIDGVPVSALIKQIHPQVTKVYDLFTKSTDVLTQASRYEGGHQPERAINLRKGAERLKLLAFETLKDLVSNLSWVEGLRSSVSEGTPAAKWVFLASLRVKMLESALKNPDSVV